MIQLFRKILCPIDCSEHSLAALDLALKVVQQNDAKLYLLSVSPVPAGAAGFQSVTDLVAHPQARVALLRHHSQRLYQIGCVEADREFVAREIDVDSFARLTHLGTGRRNRQRAARERQLDAVVAFVGKNRSPLYRI